MNACILLAALWCGPPVVEDGSLLFLENSNQFVELYTGSDVTHVAVLLNHAGEPWVYEATPSEVRRVLLDDYYDELARLNQRRSDSQKIRITLVRPRDAYRDEQVTALREMLKSQLGRRYSVKGYVRGKSDGIHCAELAARALCAASVLSLDRCQAESPATLLEKVKPVSRPLATIALAEPQAQLDWCTRSQQHWSSFGNWCQWSCWEAWTFCW